jgi:multicomponent Na+:H+ antiporter subunit F
MEIWYQRMYIAALIVLAVGILFALLRSIRGPRIADRIMGVNMIGTMSTACICILSVLLRQSWLLDVGLIYCMISFLAVVVLVKHHIADHGGKEDRDA